MVVALTAAMCRCLLAQDAQPESKGTPLRAAPTDYQASAAAGNVTLAADFTGHSMVTLEGTLTTEEFVVVEAALFAPAGTRLQISAADFSLRINGKKPLPSQSTAVVIGSLRDPEWIPPDQGEKDKSKSSFSTGGKGKKDDSLPVVVKIPIELQRAMAHRAQKAAIAEGDRPLPQAGLLFFPYRGKQKGIQSVELVYAGPAGNVTLNLQP